jgi:hypothetical protein
MHKAVEEIELPDSGALVRCRPVSPLALGPVFQSIPEPDFPMVDVESAAGGSERHPALQDTDEFVRYQKEMRQYRKEIGEAIMDFKLNSGVLAWSWDEGETWHEDVPNDWTLPWGLRKYYPGGVPSDAYDRRALYIRTEIIVSDADDDLVGNIIGSKPGTGQTNIMPEEIQAQLDPID